MKRILFISLSLLVFIFVACDEGTKNINNNDNNDVEISTLVELTLDAELDGDLLKFGGNTNLPDKTIIAYEVWHEEDFEQFEDGYIEVNNGAYEEEISLNDWPDGEIGVWVAFQTILTTTTEQPKEIIKVFGEKGENIKGNNLTKSGILNRIELEKFLVK